MGLFDTAARQIVSTTRDDDVRETALGLYGQTAMQFTPALRAVLGWRADGLRSRVQALSQPANSGRSSASLISPKLAVVARPFEALPKTEFFFNAGGGMHSNEARGSTITRDPKSGDAVDKVPPLVASRGVEIGTRSEALPGLQSSRVLWK